MLLECRGLAARLERLTGEVAALTATARSGDGSVEATVNVRGELADLAIDAVRAERLDPPALARRVVEAAGLAASAVRERTREAVVGFLPSELRHLVGADGSIDITRLLPRTVTSADVAARLERRP
jgi:DNA-binding protein YbaB